MAYSLSNLIPKPDLLSSGLTGYTPQESYPWARFAFAASLDPLPSSQRKSSDSTAVIHVRKTPPINETDRPNGKSCTNCPGAPIRSEGERYARELHAVTPTIQQNGAPAALQVAGPYTSAAALFARHPAARTGRRQLSAFPMSPKSSHDKRGGDSYPQTELHRAPYGLSVDDSG